MKLEYISDSQGITTGVYIPISEWNDLKSKYQEIELEEAYQIPKAHKDLVVERLENYKNDPGQALDFNSALDDIDNDL
ncbi:addiction module component CHP02574 family protein [Dyadobacter bucti]|uniref:addiction module component CHP02574 family protein n=1 Tax=Dyadobacter bucti TaxID=2572203 RepID=UPI0011094297|nr:addiction module component CHP02574 family protein [Dyadobacter bucti]